MAGQLFVASIVLALLAIIFPKARPAFGAFAGFGLVAAFVIFSNEAPAQGAASVTPTAEELADVRTVDVTFTSDPEGAAVLIEGSQVGTTPHTAQMPPEESFDYTIRAEEPYEDYDLYKPYSGSLTAEEGVTVDVWLDRTTAEEQRAHREERAEARAEAERKRQEAEARAAEQRLQAELRSSPWRLVRRTDEITDEDRSYVVTYATDTPSVLSDDAYLMIRCDVSDPTSSDGLSIILEADDYLGQHDLPLDWRLDDQPAVRRQLWQSSTDGTALFNLS